MKCDINPGVVTAKVEAAFKDSLPQLTEEILNDCNQYCKWDTGTLAQSAYIHSKFADGLIIWQAPYARRQYWSIETAYTDVNPGARWKWAHYAKSVHFDKWERQAQALMKGKL